MILALALLGCLAVSALLLATILTLMFWGD
jgi:hypothetical protein